MDTGIGATLREARNRRKLDLDDVEAAIKIRVRFLRAMENEEWDVLPGDTYTRGFIRTYASYLGLDGERLADEYRRGAAPTGSERVPRRVEPVASATPSRGGPRISGRALAVLVSLVLVGVLVAVGLTGGEGGDSTAPPPGAKRDTGQREGAAERPVTVAQPGVSISLAATGEVWVCMLDGTEEPVVDGEILTAGEEAGPFRSEGFTVAFGNGSVDLSIDGRQAETPASASPVGYEIGSDGDLTSLEDGERPDCE